MAVALLTAVSLTGAVGLHAHAGASSPGSVVSAVPSSSTPNVEVGSGYEVESIVQVGSTVIEGGIFARVDPPGSRSGGVARNDLFAADATTGAISATFVPRVNGGVDALAAGPLPGTVFIGGSFNSVDGVTAKGVALVNVSDGSLVTGFKIPVLDGLVNSLAVSNGTLYLGGNFGTISGQPHGGIGAVNATTGAVDSSFAVQLSGHHNYGVTCNPATSTCADGGVGIQQLAVSPDGSQLMAVGNFTTAADPVGSYHRDQVARILLGSTVRVDPNWATQRYTAACYADHYDTYLRGVAYSPDGSYVAIVATGGGGTPSPSSSGCDSAARFESASSGQSVQPTWVDYAGNDTLYAVAVTSSAIYVGGHQRWLNNANGSDSAGSGAVPRPGIAALDPTNGLPLSWNPGRNPRGAHVSVIYPTTAGIWVGGDTDYVGDYRYYRGKDSFFPYAGGEALPAEATASLPDTLYVGGGPLSSGSTLTARSFDGTNAGSASTVSTSASFSSFRGAFMVDGNLYYAATDDNLHEASFDGTTLGASTVLDPYDDPAWDNVQTGSGDTYQGSKSSFNAEMPNVTGLTYANGYVFYTLSGRSGLYYRYFTPESGIVGATEFTASSSVSFYAVEGLFVSGGTLYWANSATGALDRASFAAPSTASGNPTGAAVTGSSSIANSAVDWRGRALFLAPTKGGSPTGTPTASFTTSCTAGSCSFDGRGSTDSGGTITGYAWTFGDGATATGSTASHSYAASGTYSVSLTVTDNTGASNTHTVSVSVTVATPPPGSISYVGVSDKDSSSSAPSVPVPAGTAAGDRMLLFLTLNGTSTTVTGPGSAWTLVGTETVSGIRSSVWTKVATSSDLGSVVALSFGATYPKSDLELAVYRGVAAAGVRAYAATSDAVASAHATPGLTSTVAGDWVVSYWADKSSTTTRWSAPAGQTVRSAAYGAGTGFVGALVTDYGAGSSGAAAPLTATTNAADYKATDWTLELAAS